jgi:riboflavin transporter
LENRNKRLILLISCAMMIALGVVLKLFSITISPTMRIGFGLVPAMASGVLFGPLAGFVTGFMTDIIGFIIQPTGLWNPGTTLMYGLSGVIPALFVTRFQFKKQCKEGHNVINYSRSLDFASIRTYWRLQIGVLVSQIINSMLINTLSLALIGGKGFFVLLAARWPASLIMAFVYPVIILAVVAAYRAAFKNLPQTSLTVSLGTVKTSY